MNTYHKIIKKNDIDKKLFLDATIIDNYIKKYDCFILLYEVTININDQCSIDANDIASLCKSVDKFVKQQIKWLVILVFIFPKTSDLSEQVQNSKLKTEKKYFQCAIQSFLETKINSLLYEKFYTFYHNTYDTFSKYVENFLFIDSTNHDMISNNEEGNLYAKLEENHDKKRKILISKINNLIE